MSGVLASFQALASFYEPTKSREDYYYFIGLTGEQEVFDLESASPYCGRDDSRLDEIVFRSKDDRWILAYSPTLGHENFDKPQPCNRELSLVDASRWFMLNERWLPDGLNPLSSGMDKTRAEVGTRLDRDWRFLPSPAVAVPIAEQPASPNPNSQVTEGATPNPAGKGRKLKAPSKEAIAAYRLKVLQGKKQARIASEMSKEFGRKFNQGTISRYIKSAEKWISAGNVLPNLPKMTHKPQSIDPARLDLGRRTDGRTPRQRSKLPD
jgi:hypothetical protein